MCVICAIRVQNNPPPLVRGSNLAPAIPTGSACQTGTTCKDTANEAQPRPNKGF